MAPVGVRERRILGSVRYVLLVLAIPAALGAYLLTGTLIAGLATQGSLGQLALVFLPLFVAGLVAVPFIAPFVDHKAKEALANAPGARDRDAEGNERRTPPPSKR
jgi:flagellar biosynthesis protein FliQ